MLRAPRASFSHAASVFFASGFYLNRYHFVLVVGVGRGTTQYQECSFSPEARDKCLRTSTYCSMVRAWFEGRRTETSCTECLYLFSISGLPWGCQRTFWRFTYNNTEMYDHSGIRSDCHVPKITHDNTVVGIWYFGVSSLYITWSMILVKRVYPLWFDDLLAAVLSLDEIQEMWQHK